MFTQKDLKSIDRAYFAVKSAGCYGALLQSKNTLHCWYVTSEDYGRFKTCTIYHTHHADTPMHRHGSGRNLSSCMNKIRSHDFYQLEKDRNRRTHRKSH